MFYMFHMLGSVYSGMPVALDHWPMVTRFDLQWSYGEVMFSYVSVVNQSVCPHGEVPM